MATELRAARADEWDAFLLAVMHGFGVTAAPDDDEYPTHLLTPERSLAVFDDATIVATAGAIPFRVVVPGGAAVPVAGVTDVTVHPTHRRRGLLRQIMREQLDDVARRGEPLAALTASEASIYERFGYGTATSTISWDLASEHARFATPPVATGRFRFVDGDDAAATAHAVFSRAATGRVGEILRPETWWPPVFTPGRRGPRFFTVVHDAPDGRPDAFARYALVNRWSDAVPGNDLRVVEVQAVDADAEATMWSFLFGVDLVGTVHAADRPVDEPLRWRMPDARRMKVRLLRDHLWIRVVDVAAALSARTYGRDDALVLELVDELRPATSGRWLVEGGPDGAVCTRTDRDPDLALGAAELGALFLGGVSVSVLAAAGRVRELTTGAVRRADTFVVVHPAPWCSTHF
jgi:predicted acetyltransferase